MFKMLFRGDQPLTRAVARNCVLINQLATPGLGSIFAGRWLAGIGQLLLAIAGCVLVLIWFALTLREAYRLGDFSTTPVSYAWVGKAGGLTFAGSWLWSLVTSIQLLREARVNQVSLPPRIS